MDIYQKVKTLRKQKKISAHEFAIHCGQTSRHWTYKFENGGIKRVPRDLVLKLCDIFDVEESYFYEDGVEQFNEPTALYNSPQPDLTEVTGYKDKYLLLLVENRKLMAENIRLKNHLIENGVKSPFVSDSE